MSIPSSCSRCSQTYFINLLGNLGGDLVRPLAHLLGLAHHTSCPHLLPTPPATSPDDDEDAIRRVINNLNSCQFQNSLMKAQGADGAVVIDVEANPIGYRSVESTPRSGSTSSTFNPTFINDDENEDVHEEMRAPSPEEACERDLAERKGPQVSEIEMTPLEANLEKKEEEEKEEEKPRRSDSISIMMNADLHKEDSEGIVDNPLLNHKLILHPAVKVHNQLIES